MPCRPAALWVRWPPPPRCPGPAPRACPRLRLHPWNRRRLGASHRPVGFIHQAICTFRVVSHGTTRPHRRAPHHRCYRPLPAQLHVPPQRGLPSPRPWAAAPHHA
eukprot:7850023-Alexandrium_andersonii.AAC.1